MSDYSGEVVELEVARYGLRTFRHIPADEANLDQTDHYYRRTLQMTWSLLGIDDSQDNTGKPMELCSTAMHGSHWKGGVCEAACKVPADAHGNLLIELAALTTGVEPVYGHHAPQEDCHCGVYAAHTLQVLRDQFTGYVNDIVAVVAAEGQTIIGDKGFRTERARVVAYWCSESVAPTAGSQFPDADRYSEIASMLAAFGLERGTPSTAPDRQAWGGSVLSSGGGGGGGGATVTFREGPAKAASTRSGIRKYAAPGVNFASFAWSHSLWALGFAVASLAFGICLLVMVANS